MQVHKSEEAEINEASDTAISFGYDVGEAARKLCRHGQLAGSYEDIPSALKKTQEVLGNNADAVLFEAAFISDGILIFADIVEKTNGTLSLIEVKSSTTVKDYQLNDAAIQAWVIKSAGYEPNAIVIRHINNEFVYPGGGKYAGLFTDEDISANSATIAAEIPQWISKCRDVLQGAEPTIDIGDQCNDPFSCEFSLYCRRNLPPEPEYPVTILPRGKKVADSLIAMGYTDLRNVPEVTV